MADRNKIILASTYCTRTRPRGNFFFVCFSHPPFTSSHIPSQTRNRYAFARVPLPLFACLLCFFLFLVNLPNCFSRVFVSLWPGPKKSRWSNLSLRRDRTSTTTTHRRRRRSTAACRRPSPKDLSPAENETSIPHDRIFALLFLPTFIALSLSALRLCASSDFLFTLPRLFSPPQLLLVIKSRLTLC